MAIAPHHGCARCQRLWCCCQQETCLIVCVAPLLAVLRRVSSSIAHLFGSVLIWVVNKWSSKDVTVWLAMFSAGLSFGLEEGLHWVLGAIRGSAYSGQNCLQAETTLRLSVCFVAVWQGCSKRLSMYV